MFKKILSLTLSVMMVMALISIPTAQAEGFSEANWEQFYNDLETVSGNFDGEVIEEKDLGDYTGINTHKVIIF